MEALVELYVYDLSQWQWYNASSRKSSRSSGVAGIPLLYHTSIVAFGKEYTFNRDKGVRTIPLEEMDDGSPYKTHVLGHTTKTMNELDKFVDHLKDTLFGLGAYELVKRNCQEFCIKLCEFLGVEGLPEYVREMPNFARNTFGSETGLKAGTTFICLALAAGLGFMLQKA